MGNINSCIDLARVGDVAVITADNPPVNALGYSVRAGLLTAITRAVDDPSIGAIVLGCRGRTFFAGADITEFGTVSKPPDLPTVIEAFDRSPKPLVAGIFGTALGGGLELALGCHFRVAVATATMGLPEVKLGILPGAGGTQRLPRLIGPEKALALIVGGKPISAAEALADGAIDAMVEDSIEGAVKFAAWFLQSGRSFVRVRDREDKLGQVRIDSSGFEAAARLALRKLAGVEAPAACVESVRNSFALPFETGLRTERQLFRTLVASEQSAAQRYMFFAEREASKLPRAAGEAPPTVPQRAAFSRAVVIGAGTMGGGIAMCFAGAGIPVSLVESSPEALLHGLKRIDDSYATSLARRAMTPESRDQRRALITGTTTWDVISGSDVVIEAVFEDMDVKQEIFRRLDKVAKPDALLASNTSTLDMDAIASCTERPEAVVGLHFFSPANVMKLLEIVRAGKSSQQSLLRALALSKRLSKIPVVVGNCDGFVGNRMLARRGVESERLLLEGVRPEDVDAGLVDFGFPMGPFAMSDLAGLDVGWRIRKARGTAAPVADALCEAGRFGQKTGNGFYHYEDGARFPQPDLLVEKLARDLAQRLGVERRTVSSTEILGRLLFPMINEAARILEDGIATRPSDIDVVWVYGYGWPVWRGGPCFYADSIGAESICASLESYAARSGDPSLKPARLLCDLAARGGKFSELRGK